jgi:hypothetical protein
MSQEERVWQSEEEAEEQRVFAMERFYTRGDVNMEEGDSSLTQKWMPEIFYTARRNAAALKAFHLYMKYVWQGDGQEIAEFLYETLTMNGYLLGFTVVGSKENQEKQFKDQNPKAWPK